MKLQRPGVLLRKGDALHRPVVQGNVRNGRGVASHREAVVLTGDENAARRELEHRVIRASMPERQLERLEAGGACEELVAETDAEHGKTPEQLPDDCHLRLQDGGIARAVAQKDAARAGGEDRLCVRVVRPHRHLGPGGRETVDNRTLASVVQDGDAGPAAADTVRLARRDAGDERAAGHGGLGPDVRQHLLDGSGTRDGRCAHRAPLTQPNDERTRVDVLEGHDPLPVQPAGPIVPCRLPHEHRARVRARGLRSLRGDAVVPDHRSRERDDLLREARIRDDLLVARHRRREDRLAVGDPQRSDRPAPEDRSVLEDEQPTQLAYTTFPAATVWTTRPCSFDPSSHEFADFDLKEPWSTCQTASRSSRTRFAWAPTSIRGRSRP